MCDCVPAPPVFDIGPPPDASLVWHLISDEAFQPAADCEWSPFISVSDVGGPRGMPDRLPLLLTALAAVSLLCLCSTAFALRLRRKRIDENSKNSTEGILGGDNLWSYSSMKTSNTGTLGAPAAGVLMYGGSHGGSMLFHSTPTTIRNYPVRQSATTLRINADYNTVQHYEEIPSGRQFPHVHLPPRTHMSLPREDAPPPPHLTLSGRTSQRKPPPRCRPPPPPPSQHYSPGGSDCSLERELGRLESPPHKWDDEHRSRLSSAEGRESGYGTAPSRQWRSPQGSSGGGRDNVPIALQQAAQAQAHSMTYV